MISSKTSSAFAWLKNRTLDSVRKSQTSGCILMPFVTAANIAVLHCSAKVLLGGLPEDDVNTSNIFKLCMLNLY